MNRINPMSILLTIFLLSSIAISQPRHVNNTDYNIRCTYNPKTRIIDGEIDVLWKSAYKDNTEEIQLHLYLNAFSGPNSTFMKEYGAYPQSVADRPGFCKIQRITIYGIDVTNSMRFIQPDDHNQLDSTVVSITVPEPHDIIIQKSPNKPGLLLSAERQKSRALIPIRIEFQSQLPALLERVGVYEDFIMAAQWFPQLGVLEKGGWKCHQFHSNSEFYADFGSYDVSLTIPSDYVVGASGEMTERKLMPNGLQQLRFKADKVHDFAWCADASMYEQIEVVEDFLKQLPPTRIRLLYQPEHEGEIADRIMRAVKNGLRYFESRYGKYPYPQLTVIDAPIFNAVMEYPTLFLTGNFDGYKNPPAPAESYPNNNLFLERLTLHELGHQWFYGVCANNEAEEAWLDEGLTEYITAKAFEKQYGKIMQLDEKGNPLPVRDFRKDRYIAKPDVLPSTSKSWEFLTFGDYYIASYVKPKLLFYTLDNVLGETVMEDIFRTFYQRFSFKHPKAEDFFQVVEEIAGKAVSNQVIEFLSTSEIYDVGVTSTTVLPEIFGNMPGNLSVEVIVKSPTKPPFSNKFEINLILQSPSHSNNSEQYFISLDPNSLIEFDIDRSNNKIQFSPQEED